jgi:hypothetical protein
MEETIFVRSVKRRYIALTSLGILILFFVLNLFFQPTNYLPNNSSKKYFEYCILILQLLFTIVVFKSKNNDTKNILTTLTVIVTGVYMIIYLYNLMGI